MPIVFTLPLCYTKSEERKVRSNGKLRTDSKQKEFLKRVKAISVEINIDEREAVKSPKQNDFLYESKFHLLEHGCIGILLRENERVADSSCEKR